MLMSTIRQVLQQRKIETNSVLLLISSLKINASNDTDANVQLTCSLGIII